MRKRILLLTLMLTLIMTASLASLAEESYSARVLTITKTATRTITKTATQTITKTATQTMTATVTTTTTVTITSTKDNQSNLTIGVSPAESGSTTPLPGFRGFNLIRYYTNPYDGSSTPYDPPHEERFFNVMAGTFRANMIRMSLTTGFLEPVPGSGVLDPNFMAMLDEEIRWCVEQQMKVVLDCHVIGSSSYGPFQPEGFFKNTTMRDNWVLWWDTVLAYYDQKGWLGDPIWGADLLNEPLIWETGINTGHVKYFQYALDILSLKYPKVTFILGGLGCGSERVWPDLSWVEKYNNIVLDYHFYYDLAVISYEQWGHPVWAGLYQEGKYEEAKAAMYGDFERSRQLKAGDYVDEDLSWSPFVVLGKYPMYLGELGCGSGIPRMEPHKLHWLRDILDYCEEKGVSYLFWRYGKDDGRREWACVKYDWETPLPEGEILIEYMHRNPH